MANRDAPMGFTPLNMLDGSEIPVRQYPLLSTHVRVGIGDLIECLSAGTVDVKDDPTTSPEKILGVCVAIYDTNKNPIGSGISSTGTKYLAASVAGYVDVALAVGNAMFMAQADGSVVEIDRFSVAETTATACNTVTGRSAMEISATAATGDGGWLILDKVEEPNNAWGANVNLVVIPGESYFVGTGQYVRRGI